MVRFDEDGYLDGFESWDRYQMDRDPPRLSRWSTPFFDYEDFEGFRLPSGREALW